MRQASNSQRSSPPVMPALRPTMMMRAETGWAAYLERCRCSIAELGQAARADGVRLLERYPLRHSGEQHVP